MSEHDLEFGFGYSNEKYAFAFDKEDMAYYNYKQENASVLKHTRRKY